jgi:copper transporter 1
MDHGHMGHDMPGMDHGHKCNMNVRCTPSAGAAEL